IFAWQQARSEAACEPRPRFFTDAEDYRTLEALVDRLIPEDTGALGAVSYGAKRAKVADYVDFFLGSFLCTTATPFLYAGGPFSDRNGSATNDMATPVALTPAQRIAWRVLILGSASAAENADDTAKIAIIRANNVIAGVGDANGDTEGYQQLFQRLIAALRQTQFADLPTPAQDAILERPDLISDVMSAFGVAVEGMYGNPEYGGNRPPTITPGNPSGGATGFMDPSNRPIGWTNAFFEGDTQPQGYTTFVPDGPPDASGSAPGHYVEIPDHPMSTADPGGDPLALTAEMLALIQAALANIRI
ncbi:MAG: gluconate 2-dehydrogenase subunit 3 family protein, partial [Steroidobacteraceae bacterium]